MISAAAHVLQTPRLLTATPVDGLDGRIVGIRRRCRAGPPGGATVDDLYTRLHAAEPDLGPAPAASPGRDSAAGRQGSQRTRAGRLGQAEVEGHVEEVGPQRAADVPASQAPRHDALPDAERAVRRRPAADSQYPVGKDRDARQASAHTHAGHVDEAPEYAAVGREDVAARAQATFSEAQAAWRGRIGEEAVREQVEVGAQRVLVGPTDRGEGAARASARPGGGPHRAQRPRVALPGAESHPATAVLDAAPGQETTDGGGGASGGVRAGYVMPEPLS